MEKTYNAEIQPSQYLTSDLMTTLGLRVISDAPLLVIAIILVRYLTRDLDRALTAISDKLSDLCNAIRNRE